MHLLHGPLYTPRIQCGLPPNLRTHLKSRILGEEVCHGETENVQSGI